MGLLMTETLKKNIYYTINVFPYSINVAILYMNGLMAESCDVQPSSLHEKDYNLFIYSN